MTQPRILEVIVCSEADAAAAVEGGADRLEVISRYEVGGLTPPVELVQAIAATVRVPLRVMVRQSESFVVRDRTEIEALWAAARAFGKIGVDGIVIGLLRESPEGKCIDHELLSRVLACAPGVKATFHRAFEELTDPLAAIAELKRHSQIDRILTSGGKNLWTNKLDRLTAWQRAASPEIERVIVGGVDAEVIRLLMPANFREFHVGTAVRERQSIDGRVLADRVRELADLVR